MNLSWLSPVKLCNQCFADAKLPAIITPSVSGGTQNAPVTPFPSATAAQTADISTWLGDNPPVCSHVYVDPVRLGPSDVWADLNAKLVAIPVGLQYDVIRARYTNMVAAALASANNAGGLA